MRACEALTLILVISGCSTVVGGTGLLPEAQAAAPAKALLPVQKAPGPLCLQFAELHSCIWLISTLWSRQHRPQHTQMHCLICS